jgi:hypothetical protein
MSKLAYLGRPWTVFDAKNKLHRAWFAEFQNKRTWSNCPVRFVVADDQGDLITMIQQRLIEYYTTKEFGKIEDQKHLTLVKR